ncbi:alpha/beta hydrolase [Roseovarius sp. CAU 1744]|uniref:alpha/beta fold hydrolase n=1 Tax=Roseovarius sp. CAU 1744 TaxID=3140368 RepID=UPI00325AC097
MSLAIKAMLLLLIALIAGCSVLAERREATARSSYPPVGQFIDVGGTRVHAWVQGAGPDLVLIHGAGGNLRDFTFALTDQLAGRYRVIAFDRPGHGWTDRLPGYGGLGNTRGESPAEQAALLQKAAAELGVTRPIVVGHSYGGAVALAWGLGQPEQTAALVTLGGVSNPWPGELDRLYKVTGSALGGATVVPLITALAPEARIDTAVASVFGPQKPPEGYVDHIGGELSLRREALRANGQQVRSLRPHIVEMEQHYATRLTMPLEIVHGTADDTVPIEIHAEKLVTQAPRARLTRLPGIGHMPHHVAKAEVLAAIDRAAARAGLRR